MSKHIKEFLFRGLVCAAGGPVILGIIYGILGSTGTVSALSPSEVCKGILSITVMAFIAAGITFVYQIERLPLPSAVLIHGGVLYLAYLLMYMFNSWIPRDWTSIGIFTGIFAGGFALIWLGIYLISRSKTERLNQKLSR